MRKLVALAVCFLVGLVFLGDIAFAKEKSEYKIAWSRYVGWEPWGYMEHSGILKKWADKYGIKIKLVFFNDYIESVNQYTSGAYDGVTVTNMDALTIPSVSGVDTSAIIIGDFSNGNDGVVLRNGASCKDLRGRKVRVVELSVSHYLLARAIDKCGMTEREMTLVNDSDANIESAFMTDRDQKAAVVTWNPMLMRVRNAKNATLVFDSSQIPGEIIDMLVVRSGAPDKLKKALVGAWYEAMTVMSSQGPEATKAHEFMAKNSGATLAEFLAQLKTTAMFYDVASAVKFTRSPQLRQTMEYVRTFSFDHGLYGERKPSKNYVGIQFPDKSVMGSPSNVKLRFDDIYMSLASEGKLQ